MFASLLSTIKSVFHGIGELFNWLSGQRLVKLGRLEEQRDQQRLEEHNEKIAEELDAVPMPDDFNSVLDRLRSSRSN